MELRSMKNFLRALMFMFLTISFSCEEQGWFVNCSDCVAEEPEKAEIKIKLTDINSPVQLFVYNGLLEDNVIYDSAVISSTEYTFTVSLNTLYTFTVRYVLISGDIYTAVDSATPKVKYTKDECKDPCYFIYDKVVDLRLKYQASGK